MPIVTKNRSSENTLLAQAVRDLLSQNWSPLPVVPAQDPFEHPLKRDGKIVYQPDGKTPQPLFNGKNPSYFDSEGKPRTVAHKKYRDSRPSEEELKTWFDCPQVGVGTNGGTWIDIDQKNFDSPEALENAAAPIIEKAEWVERTQSGGYRIAIDPMSKPDFTNFGLGDCDHAGEVLSEKSNKGFVVLAPTKGEHGNYTRIKFGKPLRIERVEDLGIRPTRSHKSEPPNPTPFPTPPSPHQVHLLDLVSKKILERFNIASTGNFEGDRSREIVALAQEVYAWETLAGKNGIATDSADTLISSVAVAMGIEHKLERCLKNVSRSTVQPGLAHAKGIDTCVQRLKLKAGISDKKPKRVSSDDTIFLSPEDSPGSIAYEHLFSEDYVRIEDDFYRYEVTHYQRQDERAIKAMIRNLFERCVEQSEDSKGNISERKPYRTSAKVRDGFEYALMSVPYIPLDEVNPPGVNCLNGVLLFSPDADGIPRPRLVEHSPEMVFVDPPQVAYHPEADDTHALRLLEAISPSYRDTVLRVIASAIDLEAVRKVKGRAVRSLIFTGTGANGKDALREAVTYIFSKAGLTSCTVDDFSAYDQGRRFNLARLAGSRINWASENRVGVNIDDIQSLKQMISGDPLVTEEKFKQGQEFTPRCISIFSTNDRAINLTASLEAIASRYAIVPFTKTFVSNPTKPHELQAEPKFKYDLNWVKSEVCPALLNILIQQYQNIFAEGIDYAAFEETMEENRLEVNHLLRFAQDTGLEEDPDGQVPTDLVWERLQDWYRAEGILAVKENGDERWQENVRVGDAWVKGNQHVKPRLKKIFPAITSKPGKTRRSIVGIRFVHPAEKALLKVETWSDYLQVVSLYGKAVIDQEWHKLPPDIQSKIANLEPQATTDEGEVNQGDVHEPVSPDPLTGEEVQDFVQMLEYAAQHGTPDVLETFQALPPPHKRQVWDATPPDVKAKISKLRDPSKTREGT